MRLNSNDPHSGGATGFDTRRRIFKNDAIAGVDVQQGGCAKIDIREGLGAVHLVSIDDSAEMRSQVCAVQDEIHIGRFGIRSHGHGDVFEARKKAFNTAHEVLFQSSLHQLSEEALFGCTVFNNDCGIQIAADEIRHDVVVPFPMHSRDDRGVGGRQAELLQIRTPGFGVEGHGVDDYAVEVEEKREIVHVPRVPDRRRFLA